MLAVTAWEQANSKGTVCHKTSGNKRNIKPLGKKYNKVLFRACHAAQLIELIIIALVLILPR